MSDTHVLIVEDEERVAETYALQLKSCDTTISHSGEAALDVLDEQGDAIDVVLLDRRMPGLSGQDVLEEIRNRGLDCAVAMVTAVDPDFDIIQMGFDDYVTKPVEKTELRETVSRLASQRSYHDQVREHLAMTAKKIVLEVEKDADELGASDEYVQLVQELEASRRELDEAVAGDVFVELLLRETGDRLYLFLQYDATSWEYRYLSEEIEDRIATTDPDFDQVVPKFRQKGRHNLQLKDELGLSGYECSLHLFEDILLLHFPQGEDEGVLCGFATETASHLQEFIGIIEPYIERAEFATPDEAD